MTVRNTISVLIVLGFIGLIYVWMFYPPKGDPSTFSMLNVLIGALAAQFVAVIQYHIGSSKGSDDKNDTIKQLATGAGGDTGRGASMRLPQFGQRPLR